MRGVLIAYFPCADFSVRKAMDNVLSVAFYFITISGTVRGRRHYTEVYLAFCLLLSDFRPLYPLQGVLERRNLKWEV